MHISKDSALHVENTAPDAALKSTLPLVALMIATTCSALALYMYFFSVTPRNFIGPAILGVLGWSALSLMRLGYTRYLAHAMVAGVLFAGVVSIIAFGSLRSPGVLIFVAGVVAAGTYLGRLELMLSVAFTVCSLSALLWAEQQGLLPSPFMKVDLRTLISYLTVTVVVAVMVSHARERTQRAHLQLVAELDARRIAEEERDRSNERFGRIFRTSPSPMVAQSSNSGAIVDVNPAFERCYGYTRDQVLGRTDTLVWADQAQRARYLKRLISQRRTDQVHATALRADGSRFEVLISSELGDDAEDRLVITTVADITAQNEALESLRRSEERFAKAFNFSPLKMTITRLSDGTFVEVNQARDPVLGLGRSDLLGRSTLDTYGWLSPQERDVFVERIQREGHVSGFETRWRDADGQSFDAKIWAEMIEIDGEDCILSCFVNTTEEKRREALLLSVAQGMAGETGEDFFTSLTRHAALTLKADVVLIGELRADERIHTLSAWVDGEPVPPFDYDPNGIPCQGTLAQSELFVQESSLKASFPDAELLAILKVEAYVGQCLFDLGGTPAGVLAALWRQPINVGAEARALMSIFASRANAELIRLRRDREIEHLNETLEKRVRKRTAELQKLNAELDSFAYSVSHDLKSPLRSIDGFMHLLQEQTNGRSTSADQALMMRVMSSTRRMQGLINDLLALARVSQTQLQPVEVNLSEMAEEVIRQEQMRNPEHRVEVQIEPGLVAECDQRLAQIVLENLLGNAWKYSAQARKPRIEFVGLPRKADDLPRFELRDNGVGFEMSRADRLFKPFSRLHQPTEFKGSGIGLATVRRIIERHGGQISGEGKVGLGATFQFHFGRPAKD